MSATLTQQQYVLNRHVTTVVRRCWAETPSVKTLELVDPDGWMLPPFKPGAHVDLVMTNGLTRQYSLCGSHLDRGRYLISVLREPSSRGGSDFVHDHLAPGDVVSLSLPRNMFPLDSRAEHHLLVAGGIGITPFMSMVPALLATGASFQLHVCSRNRTNLAFAGLIDQGVRQGWAHVHFSEPPDASERLDLFDLLRAPRPGEHAYFCGPQAMLSAFLAATSQWRTECVHFERFGAPPAEGDAYCVELARTQRRFAVRAGETMANALKREGISIRTSCEAGICGMCKVPYLRGELDHRDHCLSTDERLGQLTPCVSRSSGALIVLDL